MGVIAICSRFTDGYILRVVSDDETRDLVRIELEDWDEFRPASAGHRLIERGWMIRPDARGPGTVNGWREVRAFPDAWTAPVIPTDDM